MWRRAVRALPTLQALEAIRRVRASGAINADSALFISSLALLARPAVHHTKGSTRTVGSHTLRRVALWTLGARHHRLRYHGVCESILAAVRALTRPPRGVGSCGTDHAIGGARPTSKKVVLPCLA